MLLSGNFFSTTLLEIEQDDLCREDENHGYNQSDSREVVQKNIKGICIAGKIHNNSKIGQMIAITSCLIQAA